MKGNIRYFHLYPLIFFVFLLTSCGEEEILDGPEMSMQVVFKDSQLGEKLGSVKFKVNRIKYSDGDKVDSKTFDARIRGLDVRWKEEFSSYSISQEGEVSYMYSFTGFEKEGYYSSYSQIIQSITANQPHLLVNIELTPVN